MRPCVSIPVSLPRNLCLGPPERAQRVPWMEDCQSTRHGSLKLHLGTYGQWRPATRSVPSFESCWVIRIQNCVGPLSHTASAAATFQPPGCPFSPPDLTPTAAIERHS